MAKLDISNDTLLIIVIVVIVIIFLFARGNRREGMYAVGLDSLRIPPVGMVRDAQGNTCPSWMAEPTLTGSQWPYQPEWYCRNWTGSIDTDPPVVNGCS